MIELRRVIKNYNLGETQVQALKGVDITVEKGDFVAILGPSGSGKTTLLNLIGIIDEPTAGDVIIDGHNIAEKTDKQKAALRNKAIGYIFQSFNLVPVLSALENVMFPLQIRGESGPAIKKQALDRLESVGLADFVHHRPDKLSGGQRQRVAIARALVTNPLLIIADEPTANLDSKTAYGILNFMKELNRKERVTFIFSTHDQRLIEMVDKVITLEDGKVVTC